MINKIKYIIAAILVTGILLILNAATTVASSNITETQFQSGRACEAMAKAVGFALNYPPGVVSYRGNSDSPDGSYLCFIERGDRILVRIVADETGNWGDPY